ncbi:MAG: coniferyl-aldehyde dehydrogenase, partial [Endozoicomonas sp.]
MNAAEPLTTENRKVTQMITPSLGELFSHQQQAFLKDPSPSFEERKTRLKALKRALLNNKAELLSALDADFGGRAQSESLLAE